MTQQQMIMLAETREQLKTQEQELQKLRDQFYALNIQLDKLSDFLQKQTLFNEQISTRLNLLENDKLSKSPTSDA